MRVMSNDIYVLAEHLQGRLSEVTFELLGKGRELADRLGGSLSALLLGKDIRHLASELRAADTVIYVEDEHLAEFTPEAYIKTCAALLRERAPQPRLLLLGNTSIGMDVAPALSAELGVPLVTGCTDLRLEDGRVIVTSQICGGKVLVEAELTGEQEQGIAAVMPGALPAEKRRVEREGTPQVETIAPPAPLEGLKTAFKQLIEPELEDVDISQEPVLVAVGRGIEREENLKLAEELAEALGGAVCASRPIVDRGWLPLSRLVGRSGMTVKPKLYLALGISGAPEHIEGMKSAELIIAVNSDPSAPIFNVAHYGVVGDLFKVLPPLIEELRGG